MPPKKSGKSGKLSRRQVPASSLGSTQQASLPKSTLYSHKELVATLSNSGAGFQLLGASAATPGYDVNPANALLFPWLSHPSMGFERYKFNRLKFHLVTGAASTTSGRLYMMFDYDYDDAPPTTLAQLAQSYGTVAGSVRDNLDLTVNIATLNADFKERYVSTNSSLNGVEPRTVYGGFLIIACSGVDVNTSFDLFVEYDVALRVPQAPAIAQSDAAGVALPCPFTATGYSYVSPSVGSVPKAIPGTRGVPVLPIPDPGLSTPSWAYDLRELRRGLMNLSTDISGTAGTPAAVGDAAYLDARVYDDAGGALGWLSGLATASGIVGPKIPSEMNVNGKPIATESIFRLEDLKALWPRAAFLVPLIYNGLVKMAENTLVGVIKAKLEL